MKTNSMHNFIAILIKLGTIFSWFFCFMSAINLSLIKAESPLTEKYGCIIYILISCIFTVLKIKYLRKYNENIKFQTINAVMPLFYVPLIISWCHVSFGYGRTIGILGYDRQLGVLSDMNVSRLAGSWILMATFLAVWTLVIIRTRLFAKTLEQNTKTLKVLANICIVFLITFAVLLIKRSVFDILKKGFLSDFSITWYSKSSFIYWSLNGIIIVLGKIRNIYNLE